MDTTLHRCWLCESMLPDGVYICAACENELNADNPPQNNGEEADHERPDRNESENERVRGENTRANG